MDLFNRKKVEKLESQIELLKNDIEKEKHNNDTLKDILRNSNCSSMLLEENKKLIEWIEKVLTEFSIMEVRDRNRVAIPVYKIQNETFVDSNELHRIKRQTIVIPEIIIEKQIEV